jgi:hypothetical protein
VHQDISHLNGHARPQLKASTRAHADLAQISIDIAATPLDCIDEAVRLSASRAEEMVDLGLIERVEVVDAIWGGCVAGGLVEQRGADAVQQMLVDALKPQEHEKPAGAWQKRAGPWPQLAPAGMRGLAGELARVATAHSEADPVAVMATTLAWAGASFGRNRFYRVGDTKHHARLFGALVGDISRARKGTSLGPVDRVFREAEKILKNSSTLSFPGALPLNVSHGLSSGESLVAEVRDKRDDEDAGGVLDKRLLIVEGGFGAVFRHFQRQGNTLSPTLRTAWDGWDLGTMTKQSRDRATAPHICIVAKNSQRS